jgi:hypothetical protein
LQDQNLTYTNLGDENQKGKQVFCFWVVGKIIFVMTVIHRI